MEWIFIIGALVFAVFMFYSAFKGKGATNKVVPIILGVLAAGVGLFGVAFMTSSWS